MSLKVLLVLLAVVAVASAVRLVPQKKPATLRDTDLVQDDDLIAYINNNNFPWKAAHYPQFEGMTWAEAKRLCGVIKGKGKLPVAEGNNKPVGQPASFDWRQKSPSCVHPILNQGQCGSCWAFGASESLSDRTCISSNGATNVVLSPEYLVSCDQQDGGCNGGELNTAWEFMEKTGLPTLTCVPYTAGSGYAPPCSNSCADNSQLKFYKAQGSQQFTGVTNIENEIYTNGPVEAAFTVYQDFFNYQSGVYVHKSGGEAGGHAIKILGWGHDSASNLDYWIVANSWGTSWGQQGFFWIAKGQDECGIEDDVVAGKPASS